MRGDSNLTEQLGQLATPMAKCGNSLAEICRNHFCDLNESTHLSLLGCEVPIMKREQVNKHVGFHCCSLSVVYPIYKKPFWLGPSCKR